MNVETGVRSVIIEVINLNIAPKDLAGDTPLLEGGLRLDSVVALKIVLGLEKEFGFQIEVGELSRDVFKDINHLTDFARRKLQAGETAREGR